MRATAPPASTYSSSPDGPTGIVSTLGYDSRGRKTALSSPDTGSLAYTYNGVDELIEQADALNQSTTHSYDGLGRLVGRTDRSTNGGITRTSWTYDSCDKGIGKLCKIEQSETRNDRPVLPVTLENTYDASGRLYASFEYIEVFYNRTRQHSTLGYRSPVQFLENWIRG